MDSATNLIQQGSGWLFIPSAILLGALHGLEPGHSKTMMAAFIVAIRGTVKQAIMLGLATTVSHTAIVWLIAMLGLTYGQQWNSEATEPYLKLISGILIIIVALWVMARTHREHIKHHRDHEHGHEHTHDDAHARKHAEDIKKHLAKKTVTDGQIIMFGLTGGLLPCPAAITVLLLCLQLKQFTLGVGLVLGFSIGLAITLVASGAIAAWGMRHATRRWSFFNTLAARAPYFSSVVIIMVGLYVGWQGLRELSAL